MNAMEYSLSNHSVIVIVVVFFISKHQLERQVKEWKKHTLPTITTTVNRVQRGLGDLSLERVAFKPMALVCNIEFARAFNFRWFRKQIELHKEKKVKFFFSESESRSLALHNLFIWSVIVMNLRSLCACITVKS